VHAVAKVPGVECAVEVAAAGVVIGGVGVEGACGVDDASGTVAVAVVESVGVYAVGDVGVEVGIAGEEGAGSVGDAGSIVGDLECCRRALSCLWCCCRGCRGCFCY